MLNKKQTQAAARVIDASITAATQAGILDRVKSDIGETIHTLVCQSRHREVYHHLRVWKEQQGV